MKPFELSTNSWHYKLANFGDRRAGYDEDDICSYTRAVLAGGFWFLVTALFLIGMGSFYVFAVMNFLGWMFLGYFLEPATVLLLGFTVALIVSVAGAVMYREWNDNRVDEPSDAEPGFIRLAYRRFKEKTCARVVFKHE